MSGVGIHAARSPRLATPCGHHKRTHEKEQSKMTTLRELFNLPERVNPGDFVLKLSDVVDHPDVVLKDYVVTDQLAKCFDDALALVESAVTSRETKATYLHGSFGAGKSHFMAVLYLLLQATTAARFLEKLAPCVT